VKDLEFFRNATLGQYVDSPSRVHAFAPLTKYLGLLALAAPALASRTAYAALAVMALGLLVALAAGVRPAFLLRGLKPALPALALIMALQILLSWPGDASAALLRLGPIDVTVAELANSARIAARLAALMVTLGLFTATASESQIVHGIEDILAPLSRLGIPAHRLALVVGIAFRFIPILAGEAELIVKAQASRGADFGSGTRNPFRRVKAWLPVLVPLMLRALERSESLVEAMEARGYSGGLRSRLASYPAGRGEKALRIALVLFGSLSVFLASRAPSPWGT